VIEIGEKNLFLEHRGIVELDECRCHCCVGRCGEVAQALCYLIVEIACRCCVLLCTHFYTRRRRCSCVKWLFCPRC